VGTGGGQENQAIVGEPVANCEVHNEETDGILKLTLRPKGCHNGGVSKGWTAVSTEKGERDG
jgi:hypothetical protein